MSVFRPQNSKGWNLPEAIMMSKKGMKGMKPENAR